MECEKVGLRLKVWRSLSQFFKAAILFTNAVIQHWIRATIYNTTTHTQSIFPNNRSSRINKTLTTEHSASFASPHSIQADGGALGEDAGSQTGRYRTVWRDSMGRYWRTRNRLERRTKD